jgi:hypothetical protein
MTPLSGLTFLLLHKFLEALRCNDLPEHNGNGLSSRFRSQDLRGFVDEVSIESDRASFDRHLISHIMPALRQMIRGDAHRLN